MTDGLVWEQRPELRRPLLVAAFSGWNDAGDAATGAADWLIRQRDPRRIAVHRTRRAPRLPVAPPAGRAGRRRRRASITWPANDCFVGHVRRARPRGAARRRAERAVEVVLQRGADGRVGDGLRDGRHPRRVCSATCRTRAAVRVTGTASDPAADQRARAHPLAVRRAPPASSACCTTRAAPAACARRRCGRRSRTTWPRRRTRRRRARCSSASAQLADLPLDLHGLDQLVDLWRVQVDHAIRDNDEVTDYVRELEGRVDAEDAERARHRARRPSRRAAARSPTPTISPPRSSASSASRTANPDDRHGGRSAHAPTAPACGPGPASSPSIARSWREQSPDRRGRARPPPTTASTTPSDSWSTRSSLPWNMVAKSS